MKPVNILIAVGVAAVLITSGYVFGNISAKRHMWHHAMSMKAMSQHWGGGYHGGSRHGMGCGRRMGCGHKMGGCKHRAGGKCHKSRKYAHGKHGKHGKKYAKRSKHKKYRAGRLWDLNRDGRVSPEENMNFAMRRFYTHDRDGDGALSREEFLPAGKGGRQGMARHAGMFDRLDIDSDGKLELEEAQTMAEQHFRDADLDRDGYLNRQEKRLGMMALYGMDAGEVFKKADRNADGNLSQEEFQSLMMPRRSERRR